MIKETEHEIVKAIYYKMVEVVEKHHVYEGLFRSDDSLRIVSGCDYGVMAVFQESLANDLMAGMFRLIDPKKSCGSENISFEHLKHSMVISDDVKAIIDDMYILKEEVENYRNKVLMHNDAKVVLGKSDQDVIFEWEKLSRLVVMGCVAISKVYNDSFGSGVGEFVPVNVQPKCFLRALEAKL